jgi:hypothetical protein
MSWGRNKQSKCPWAPLPSRIDRARGPWCGLESGAWATRPLLLVSPGLVSGCSCKETGGMCQHSMAPGHLCCCHVLCWQSCKTHLFMYAYGHINTHMCARMYIHIHIRMCIHTCHIAACSRVASAAFINANLSTSRPARGPCCTWRKRAFTDMCLRSMNPADTSVSLPHCRTFSLACSIPCALGKPQRSCVQAWVCALSGAMCMYVHKYVYTDTCIPASI